MEGRRGRGRPRGGRSGRGGLSSSSEEGNGGGASDPVVRPAHTGAPAGKVGRAKTSVTTDHHGQRSHTHTAPPRLPMAQRISGGRPHLNAAAAAAAASSAQTAVREAEGESDEDEEILFSYLPPLPTMYGGVVPLTAETVGESQPHLHAQVARVKGAATALDARDTTGVTEAERAADVDGDDDAVEMWGDSDAAPTAASSHHSDSDTVDGECASDEHGSAVGNEVEASNADEAEGPPKCRYFARGNCRHGAACQFAHGTIDSTASAAVGEDAEEGEGEDAYEDACGDVGDQDPKENPYPQDDEDSGCITCPNKRATGCANSMCEECCSEAGEETCSLGRHGASVEEASAAWGADGDYGDYGDDEVYDETTTTTTATADDSGQRQCLECSDYRNEDCANACCAYCCGETGRATCYADGHDKSAVQSGSTWDDGFRTTPTRGGAIGSNVDPQYCVKCGNYASKNCTNNACKPCCAEFDFDCALPKHGGPKQDFSDSADPHAASSGGKLASCTYCSSVAGKRCDYWCCTTCCFQREDGGVCSQHY